MGYHGLLIKVLLIGLQDVLDIMAISVMYLLEQLIKKIYLHYLAVETKKKWFVIIEKLKIFNVKKL